jgi:hypothetical protein
VKAVRARKAQRQIDEDIRQAMADGASTIQQLEGALHRLKVEQRHRELMLQRIQTIITDKSERRKQAELEVMKYLPALPRSAKRIFNHLRILLVVAERKQVFGGEPVLEAQHIAKWAVLLERWPDLGSMITYDPQRMVRLEEAGSLDGLSSLSGSSIPGLAVSPDLLAFLQSSPKLGAC